MGNIRREGRFEGEEPPSAELSGHDQQMGGQGERNERDSWGDRGDKAEIEKRGRDAEQKRGDWPACKKENKRRKRAEQRCGETKGVAERMQTEEKMIKCSGKQAKTLAAGWWDRQSRTCP